MPIVVRTDDERLRSFVRRNCPGARVTADGSADLHLVRTEGAGDVVSLVRVHADRPRETLWTTSLDLLLDPGSGGGPVLAALCALAAEARDAAIAGWIERISSHETPQRQLEAAVERLRALSRARAVSLLLADPLSERFSVAAGDPIDAGDEWVAGIPPAVLRRAAAGEPARLTLPSGWGAVVALSQGENIIGFARLELDSSVEELNPDVCEFLRRVTPTLATARALAREREMALMDDLTRAYNRRYFDTALDEEIERARRYGSSVALVFLDLDDLKAVNNRWGHLTGSRVLQEVARRILGAVRTLDRVVRFGGDEFCIILPQSGTEQALLVAERVREAIAVEPIRLIETDPIAITASFGVACYPEHAERRDSLIRAADAAMYRSKTSGKGSIGVAGDHEPAPQSSARS